MPAVNRRRRSWHHARCLLLACACTPLLAGVARAQAASPESADQSPEVTAVRTPTHHPRRLYVAMWTTHLRKRVLALDDNNWMAGVTAGGYFGATFRNSYGKRAYVAGLQRTLISAGGPSFHTSIGIRFGGITGYDRRLISIAGKTPVMPFVQPFAAVEAGRLGLDVSYTFVVVSAAVSLAF